MEINFLQALKEQSIEKRQKYIIYFFENKDSGKASSQETKQPHSPNQNEINKIDNAPCGKIKRIINPNKAIINNNEIEEMKKYLENGNVKAFLDFLENNKSYLSYFLMLLKDEKYLNLKISKIFVNFIYSLISLPNKKIS